MFIGLIQAFIFALLTILYFGMAASGHGGDVPRNCGRTSHEAEESEERELQPA